MSTEPHTRRSVQPSRRFSLGDLSYRHKIPLILSAVILLTACILSAALVVRSYQDLRLDLISSAESLGKALARALVPIMLRDEVWLAYETITTPLDVERELETGAKVIVVLDKELRVYASSHPARVPIFRPLAESERVFGPAQERIAAGMKEPVVLDESIGNQIVVLVPILSDDGSRLGTVLLASSESLFLPRFHASLRQGILWTGVVLAILLPLGWYAGNRVATPLMQLASAFRRVGRDEPARISHGLHLGKDEIGQVGVQFKHMLDELEEKRALERRVIAADRLAAIGRLTAGIAHEINNPLGGMLNSINTWKLHGSPDPVAQKTASLLERGLLQIKQTVGALLVEAKVESHALTRDDLQDIHTLVAPEAIDKHLRLHWENEIADSLPLPSVQVRQVLINLLLNAVQAAEPAGQVACRIARVNGSLVLDVRNDGGSIPLEQVEHLFEPFNTTAGNGLGLWVTYQIVRQLGGEIQPHTGDSETRFVVRLPIEASA
jgi:signal transduction histidine kinase